MFSSWLYNFWINKLFYQWKVQKIGLKNKSIYVIIILFFLLYGLTFTKQLKLKVWLWNYFQMFHFMVVWGSSKRECLFHSKNCTRRWSQKKAPNCWKKLCPTSLWPKGKKDLNTVISQFECRSILFLVWKEIFYVDSNLLFGQLNIV